jgi:hypothetical protein
MGLCLGSKEEPFAYNGEYAISGSFFLKPDYDPRGKTALAIASENAHFPA